MITIPSQWPAAKLVFAVILPLCIFWYWCLFFEQQKIKFLFCGQCTRKSGRLLFVFKSATVMKQTKKNLKVKAILLFRLLLPCYNSQRIFSTSFIFFDGSSVRIPANSTFPPVADLNLQKCETVPNKNVSCNDGKKPICAVHLFLISWLQKTCFKYKNNIKFFSNRPPKR